MVLLPDDDRLNPQDPNAATGAALGGITNPAPSSGGGSIAGGAGSGAVGSPTAVGGSSGWTNIQSYLKANQGNTSSADYLKDKAGSAIDQDKTRLETTANDAKTKATAEVDKNKIGTDQASQLIQAAGSAGPGFGRTSTAPPSSIPGSLNPGSATPIGGGAPVAPGTAAPAPVAQAPAAPVYGQAYGDSVKKLQGSLGAQYGGPKDYTYANGADTERYGQGLAGDDNAFKGLMQGVYRDASGGKIGLGGLNLQEQLDTSNDALAGARGDLGGRYRALNSLAFGDDGQGGLVKGTNDALVGAQNQFGADQADLRGYLGSQGTLNHDAVKNKADQYERQRQAFIAQNPLGDYSDSNSTSSLNLHRDYLGDDANMGNVRGVDQQRNQYNAIMEALGQQDRIGMADKAYDIGNISEKGVFNNGLFGSSPIDNSYYGADFDRANPLSRYQ